MRIGVWVLAACCAFSPSAGAFGQAQPPQQAASPSATPTPVPPSAADSSPASTAGEPPPSVPASPGILVVGGTRATGLEIVKLLQARGHSVTVMARHTSDLAALEKLGIPVVRADALAAAEVNAAILPGRYRAVISTLGASSKERVRPDFTGNRNLIDAAKAAGVQRFLLVTVIGAGDSSDSPPLIAKWFLKDVIALKSQAEDYLKASGLDYTIIRPGGLLDKEPSGKAVLSEDPETFSWIARADLGQLVADALEDRKTIGKTYSAFDPTRERFWSTWRD